MPDNTSPNPPKRVLWRAATGDVCDFYRQALERGATVSVEGLLSQLPEEDRPAALWAMLRSEVGYLRSRGQNPARNELLRRFPGQRELVEAVLPTASDRHRIEAALEGDELVRTTGDSLVGSVYQVRRLPSGDLHAVRDLPAPLIDPTRRDDSRIADLSFVFHKNLARPFELLEFDGHVLLVTEYVEGENLATLVNRRGPLPVGAACAIIREAADGLAQVHEHWRCHGDVRPQSIVLDPTDLQVKVVGLGLTELLDPRFLRYAESAPGELSARAFRAPELSESPPRLDLFSDVYGLGAVLYFLLTGSLPDRGRVGGLAMQLHSQCPSCPPGLEALVGRMMAHESDERPASGASVRDAVAPFADPRELAVWVDGAGPSSTPTQTALQSAPMPADPANATCDPTAEPSPAARPRRSRVAGLVIAAGLGLLLLAGASYLLWRGREAPPLLDAPLWASAIAETPSVHGDWWFDETPWNGPIVRAAILERSRTGEPVSSRVDLESTVRSLATAPDRRAADDARAVVEELAAAADGAEWDAVRSLLLTDPDRQTIVDREEQYAAMLAQLPNGQGATAAVRHTRGLLHHALGQHDDALQQYDAACAAYADAGLRQLEAVCHADAARVHRDRRDYLRAIQRLNLSNQSSTSAARLVCNHCQLAYCNRKRGYIEEAKKNLRDAEAIAGDTQRMALGANHPLRSALLIEHGWLDLDNWNLDRADRWFEQADQMIRGSVDPDSASEFYKQLWVRQNRAMVQHFRGDAAGARQSYVKMLSGIQSQLDRNLKPRQAARIASRQPNLFERLGDSYLCGSPADYKQAAATYNQAYRSAVATGSGFDMKAGWPYVVNFRYKQAVALCLDWRHDEAARLMEAIAQMVEEHNSVTGGQHAAYAGSKQLAEAALRMNAEADAQTLSNSHHQLADYCVDRVRGFAAKGHVSRSELDTLLLSIEFLLQPSNVDPSTADNLIDSLQYVTDNVHREGGVTDAYLRRFVQTGLTSGESILADGGQRLDRLRGIAARGARLEGPPQRGSIAIDADGLPDDCRLFALNIGVSDYRESSLRLRHGADDAVFLSECFAGLCEGESAIYSKGYIKTLCNDQATRRGIYHWIDGFREGRDSEGLPAVRPHDLVFVTFSGHGVRAHGDRSYLLLPYDYESGVDSTAIHDDMLANKLTDLGATVILALDSCFSGHAIDPGTLVARSDRADELRKLAMTQVRNFSSANGAGVVVLASSVSSMESYEDRRLGHGFLTLALGEALQGKYQSHSERAPPIPTGVGSGMVTLKDVEYYLGQRVLQLSGGRQRLPDARGVSGAASLAQLPIRLATEP